MPTPEQLVQSVRRRGITLFDRALRGPGAPASFVLPDAGMWERAVGGLPRAGMGSWGMLDLVLAGTPQADQVGPSQSAWLDWQKKERDERLVEIVQEVWRWHPQGGPPAAVAMAILAEQVFAPTLRRQAQLQAAALRDGIDLFAKDCELLGVERADLAAMSERLARDIPPILGQLPRIERFFRARGSHRPIPRIRVETATPATADVLPLAHFDPFCDEVQINLPLLALNEIVRTWTRSDATADPSRRAEIVRLATDIFNLPLLSWGTILCHEIVHAFAWYEIGPDPQLPSPYRRVAVGLHLFPVSLQGAGWIPAGPEEVSWPAAWKMLTHLDEALTEAETGRLFSFLGDGAPAGWEYAQQTSYRQVLPVLDAIQSWLGATRLRRIYYREGGASLLARLPWSADDPAWDPWNSLDLSPLAERLHALAPRARGHHGPERRTLPRVGAQHLPFISSPTAVAPSAKPTPFADDRREV